MKIKTVAHGFKFNATEGNIQWISQTNTFGAATWAIPSAFLPSGKQNSVAGDKSKEAGLIGINIVNINPGADSRDPPRIDYQAVLATNTAPTFVVGDGKTSTDFGLGSDGAVSTIRQPDGKLLAVGSHYGNGIWQLALARYSADGSLDASFSGDGKLTLSLGTGDAYVNSIALQADGKLLVAGQSNNGSNDDFTVVRFNTDGSLDSSFSGDGVVTTDFGRKDGGYSIVAQADGKILVLGASGDYEAAARYNPDGSLDTGFSGDGKFTTAVNFHTALGSKTAAVADVALQADGKILVAGSSANGGADDFALARYNADGSLDKSFAGDGAVTTPVSSGWDDCNRIAVQADGKILAIGSSQNPDRYDFALVRYNADGSLDNGFGNGGIVTTNFGSNMFGLSDDRCTGVALQADGKIIAVGTSDSYIALARYNADGSLDSSFSGDGEITTAVGEYGAEGYSVTLQADGKIVVTGNSYNGANRDFALLRYNADGSLDTSFGIDDTLANSRTAFTEGGNPAVLDSDAQVYDAQLAALNGGLGNYADATLTLARHGGANSEDRYSGAGIVAGQASGDVVTAATTVGTYSWTAGALKLVFNTAATQALVNQTLQFIAYQNTSDTPPASVQIDWLFSDGNTGSQGSGSALTNTGSTTVAITAVNDLPIITSNGGGILATISVAENKKAVTTVIASDADGDKPTYAITGGADAAKFTVDSNTGVLAFTTAPDFEHPSDSDANNAYLVKVTADDGHGGKDVQTITVKVTAVNEAPTFMTGKGTLTTDFGGDDYAGSASLQADGKILVAGNNNYGHSIAIARYNPDGSLDASFYGNGKLTTTANGDYQFNSYAVQPDGKILAAGNDWYHYGIALARFNPDGSLDSGFGIREASFNSSADSYGYSVFLQPNGKILVAGITDFTTGNGKFALARFNTNGSLDTSFDGDGELTTDLSSARDIARSIAVQADGKILVAGFSNYDFGLVRYNPDGSLDTSFSGGKLTTDFGATEDDGYSIMLQPDGKILVAGYSHKSGGHDNFALARYTSDGGLDFSFSGDGKLTTDFTWGEAYSVALQADGKILVAGSGYLVRYNTDGSLDTSFDGDGIVTTYGLDGRNIVVQPDGKILVTGQAYNGKDFDFAVARYNADGSLDAKFAYAPGALNSTVAYLEGSHSVVMNDSIGIYDTDLVALNGGLGNYAGAKLTLTRHGGANGNDYFSGAGIIAGQASGNVTVSASNIGAYTWNAGKLTITFSNYASQALVNQALQSLVYQNAGVHPLASVQIDWTFSDGNTGKQGVGGALATTGSVIINNPPIITSNGGGDAASISITENTTAVTTITASDLNGDLITYAITGGADASRFTINSATGVLAFANAPDFEHPTDSDSNNIYQVQVTANDGKGGVDSQAIAVTVTNIIENTAPTFNVGGSVLFGNVSAYGAFLSGWREILVAGVSSNGGTTDFTLLSYGSNGEPSINFGNHGTVITDFFGGNDIAKGIAAQPDGKLLVVGQTFDGNSHDFAIARYNPFFGTLDTSFSGGGLLTTDVGDTVSGYKSNDFANCVTTQSDGKILVAGQTHAWGSGIDFALVRYNPDGSLDTSFDKDGKVITDFTGNTDVARSIVVQADDKILVAGGSYSLYDYSGLELARYNADGSLDKTFGTYSESGKIRTSLEISAESIALQADGKILVAGLCHDYNYANNPDFGLVRFDTHGNLDTTFGGGDGIVQTDIRGSKNGPLYSYDYDYGIAVQSSGKIVVAGISDNYYYALVRYNSNGSLDTTFGKDGKVTTYAGVNLGGIHDSVMVQPDDKIVVVSSAGMVRYNADGSVDNSSFGVYNSVNGQAAFTEGGSAVILSAKAQVYDADLHSWVSYGNYEGTTLTLARHGGANSDDRFSGAGIVAGQASGNISVGSYTWVAGQLTILFNSATQAAVNQTLQSIAYQNASDTPPASVQIDWTFNDGNTGSQGIGGALTATAITTVNITAVNDLPVITSNGGGDTAAIGVAENTKLVTTVTASDLEHDPLTYTLTGGADAAKFTLNKSTGTLAFITAPDYEHPTDSDANNSYLVYVSVSDGHGGTDTQTITVNVLAVNEPPIITSNGGGTSAAISVPENNTAVTTVTANDPDGDPLIYSIIGGDDAAKFTLDSHTGVLAFAVAPDYEQPSDKDANNIYWVKVAAGDGHGRSDSQVLTITVNNVSGYWAGTAGNDVLTGTSEEDTLLGNAGNDTLTGNNGADLFIGGLGKDKFILTETDAAADVVKIAAGDSLKTSYDTVTGFTLGNSTQSAGVDQLDLDTVKIASAVATSDGINVGSILSSSIDANGIVRFDDINTFKTALNLTVIGVANALTYLETNLTDGSTVAFTALGNSYVFQDGGAQADTVVQLTGVTVSGLSADGLLVGGVWLV